LRPLERAAMTPKIRNLLIGGLGVGAVVLAAVAGLHLTGRLPSGGGVMDRITSSIQSVTGGGAPATQAEFAFRRLEIDTARTQAEACLVFTRRLDGSGKTDYL